MSISGSYPMDHPIKLASSPMHVVYFDQQTGAPHTVSWSKSVFDIKKTFFILLSHKIYKIMQQITKTHDVFVRLSFIFSLFCSFSTWKCCLASKKLFQPANDMLSTHSLVEIHNACPLLLFLSPPGKIGLVKNGDHDLGIIFKFKLLQICFLPVEHRSYNEVFKFSSTILIPPHPTPKTYP